MKSNKPIIFFWSNFRSLTKRNIHIMNQEDNLESDNVLTIDEWRSLIRIVQKTNGGQENDILKKMSEIVLQFPNRNTNELSKEDWCHLLNKVKGLGTMERIKSEIENPEIQLEIKDAMIIAEKIRSIISGLPKDE